MATLNGAKALGIDAQTGSLESGKCADLIAINMDALNSQPSYDPISDIVYSVSASQVSHSWINGQLQLENSELVHLNARKIIDKAQYWAQKIKTNR
jgi:5-methylthioadenosine/S-adenosylhomocysteine deaminase